MQRPAGVIENDITVMGCVPQAQTLGDGYDYRAPNSVHELPMQGLADFEPNLGQVTLEVRAKLTDLLDCTPMGQTVGLLVSPKLRELLTRFELQPHRFYEVPVVQRVARKRKQPQEPPRPIGTYHLLHLPALVPELPDDKAAAESAINELFPNAELVHVRAPAKYHGIYAGGELKRAIEAEGITGIRFRFARLLR